MIFNYLKVFFGIFIVLSFSRFIPHPPNFTSLLALSFYVPALLGRKYILALIFSFVLTDLIIGFHNTLLFTWGSIYLISFLPKYFKDSFLKRICGALMGAIIFFVITNFGVWCLGYYDYSIKGLILCYSLAVPFFTYSLISTLIFSTLIETIYKVKFIKNFFQCINQAN